jgi:stage V sporulation protein G
MSLWRILRIDLIYHVPVSRSTFGSLTSPITSGIRTKELVMHLSEIRINLCGPSAGRLKAFCSLTFDNTFVIRDVKLIEGNDGLFLAMPSRKLCDRCRRCGEKNHLRARFCNNCGVRLDENRYLHSQHPVRSMNGHGNGHSNGNGDGGRLKLHADIAHPINTDCRLQIEQQVLSAYRDEIDRSKQPGYVPPALDGDCLDLDAHAEMVTSLRVPRAVG